MPIPKPTRETMSRLLCGFCADFYCALLKACSQWPQMKAKKPRVVFELERSDFTKAKKVAKRRRLRSPSALSKHLLIQEVDREK